MAIALSPKRVRHVVHLELRSPELDHAVCVYPTPADRFAFDAVDGDVLAGVHLADGVVDAPAARAEESLRRDVLDDTIGRLGEPVRKLGA